MRLVDNEMAYQSYLDCGSCEQGKRNEEMFQGHDLYPMKHHKIHKRETPKKRGKQGTSAYSSHYESPPVELRNSPERELQADRQVRRDLPGGQEDSHSPNRLNLGIGVEECISGSSTSSVMPTVRSQYREREIRDKNHIKALRRGEATPQLSQAEKDIADLLEMLGRSPY